MRFLFSNRLTLFVNHSIINTVEKQNAKKQKMRNYLVNLITEKGVGIDSLINLEGHIGLTWEMLIDFICSMPQYHESIRKTLVMIDFKNGDVFHYLNHLAEGMVKSAGH